MVFMFYITFWKVTGGDLLAVLDESLARVSLPLCYRWAVFTLLPKKGDLCSDHKIFEKFWQVE